MSERQIHYNLLNDPPLVHASKPDSRYRNDHNSAKQLSDLVTRARLEGTIPEDAVCDETRPVTTWNIHRAAGDFVELQMKRFLNGYWRDLMQSQPNHLEILAEKNTVAGILRDVASEFGIPITSGRGFASLPPRIAMKNRFHRSGKEKLILILVSDFDPSGEWIATSFARSMRDDFDLEVHPIKAALTYEQVRTMPDLPQSVDTGEKATDDNTHYKAFREKYGPVDEQGWYELEALAPTVLQDIVRKAIDGVIDRERFNAEVQKMQEEATDLAGLRRTVIDLLKTVKLPN